MFGVTLINTIAVLFAVLGRLSNNKNLFWLAIIVCIVGFGIRTNYGNDFDAYKLILRSNLFLIYSISMISMTD